MTAFKGLNLTSSNLNEVMRAGPLTQQYLKTFREHVYHYIWHFYEIYYGKSLLETPVVILCSLPKEVLNELRWANLNSSVESVLSLY